MKKFLSFSSNPGTTGSRYYTYFFNKYDILATYTPLKVTDLASAIDLAQTIGASGFSVSMPFKKQVISYLDDIDTRVRDHSSCNTVKIIDNKLIGYNADYQGALAISRLISPFQYVTILGNGAMGSMLHRLLPSSKLVSRSLNNWHERFEPVDVIINCTALGTICEDSPFDVLPKTSLVVDLALKENNLKLQCKDKNVKYVSGTYFYEHNFLEQFRIYTGIQLNDSEFKAL